MGKIYVPITGEFYDGAMPLKAFHTEKAAIDWLDAYVMQECISVGHTEIYEEERECYWIQEVELEE